jgi:hypothetical protein
MLLLCIWAVGTAEPARAGPNVIRNGGFEEGPGKFPGVGLYWETNDGQKHPDIDVLTANSRHGRRRCQYLKANPKWDLGAVRQVSAYGSVKPGRTYLIQAWVKTSGVRNPAGWYVFGAWWFKGDTYLGDSKMPRQETNNYDWRLISWTAVAPPGADRVAAFLSRHTDGNAWYDDVYIGEIGDGPSTIALKPASFSQRMRKNDSLADDTFTVQNVGGSKLKYTITTSAEWLSVDPRAGLSVGNIDACSIHYNLNNLTPGRHSATVTIAGPAATNSPQTIPVAVSVGIGGSDAAVEPDSATTRPAAATTTTRTSAVP